MFSEKSLAGRKLSTCCNCGYRQRNWNSSTSWVLIKILVSAIGISQNLHYYNLNYQTSPRMNLSLENKTYLIAGGSKGIGLALSQQLLAAGANVHVFSRTAPTLPQNDRLVHQYATLLPTSSKRLNCRMQSTVSLTVRER